GFEKRLNDGSADGLGVHGLRQDLDGDDIVVAVDDEAGEEIGFAEDNAVGVGIGDELLAIGGGGADAVGDEFGQVGDFGIVLGDHADGDLRRGAVESRAEDFSSLVGDMDHRAGCDAIGGGDVGTIDPGMSGFEAGCAARSEPFERNTQARTGRSPLRSLRTGFADDMLAVTVPLITFFSAAWNCSISPAVPTVMRTWVGQTGQMRPMCTCCAAMASMTSLPLRLVSSMKQFDCEGT